LTRDVPVPQRPGRSGTRITFVDVSLWGLRVAALAAVFAGTTLSLLRSRYELPQWFEFIVAGITMGSIYAQVALGYTMVYGVLRMINFAHGDITMGGAFAGYFVATASDRAGVLQSHPLLALAATLLASSAVAMGIALLVERIAYRPFRHVRGFAPLVCAIGASLFLEQTFRGLFGSSVKSYPDLGWQDVAFGVGSFRIRQLDVVVICCAVAAMAVLHFIVNKTRMGTAIRAVAEDAEVAALMGIDVNRAVAFTFLLGGAMAGIAGVCYAFVFKQVYFYMGIMLGIKAFAAALLGGMGSVPGAMLGGFVLGLAESVGPALFFDSIGIRAPFQLRDLIAFALLIGVLIFRPNGLLGERSVTSRV
jgi:branched-chain amino acid transport system permease protein